MTNDTFLKVARDVLGGQPIVVIDGGARNKTWELAGLASLCDVLAFEPNPDELSRIMSGSTDLETACGLVDLPYHSIRYLGAALSGSAGRAVLHVTEGPGACSLLEPDAELIARLEYYHPYEKPFAPQFRVVRTEEVQTTTLDLVGRDYGLSWIDHLKLDTQGNELDCLEGARDLLDERKIGFIKTEAHFLEVYKRSRTFGDIDRFLRERGFVLLDLSYWSEHRVIWSGRRMRGDKGTLLFADAYYILSLDEHRRLDPRAAVRHALVAGELGFGDFGIALLQSVSTVDSQCISVLSDWWQRDTRSRKQKMKDVVKQALRAVGRVVGD